MPLEGNFGKETVDLLNLILTPFIAERLQGA